MLVFTCSSPMDLQGQMLMPKFKSQAQQLSLFLDRELLILNVPLEELTT